MTHRESFLKRHGLSTDTSLSLAQISKLSGVSKAILQQVYNRGVGAWKSNPESVRLLSGKKNYSSSRAGKMSKEQWAMARVYSYVDKGTTYYTTDADLRKT